MYDYHNGYDEVLPDDDDNTDEENEVENDFNDLLPDEFMEKYL